MNWNKNSITSAGIVVALILLTACQSYTVGGDRLVLYSKKARSKCASEWGTPKDALLVMLARHGELSGLSRTLYTYKFADVRNANSYSIDLAADGKEVDSARLIAGEIEARRSLYAG